MSTLIKQYNERMTKVMLYIQRNLDSDLSPERLAELACFSVPHFHRIFKRMVGENLKEHVRRLRLERSTYFLSYTDRSVMEIALDAKYESPETFSRAFKKMFKMPPSEFRTKSRGIIRPSGKGKIHYQPEPSTQKILFLESSILDTIESRYHSKTKVAFVRHVGSYFDTDKAWDKLCSWAESKNLINSETEYFGLSYDDPGITPARKIRYDACLSVNCEIPPTDEIGIQFIPEGKYAVATHHGPYEGLVEAYQDIFMKWLPNCDIDLTEDLFTFEKYIKTPSDHATKDLHTEIWVGIY